MPLTLEMFGKKKLFSHVIIDRNNLIFVFPEGRYDSRNEFTALFRAYAPRRPEEGNISYDSKDPRHLVQEHMSEYDLNKPHLHIGLKRTLTFADIRTYFSALKQAPGIQEFMTEESYQDILKITESYFMEFKESKLSQKLEQAYCADKNREFALADKSKFIETHEADAEMIFMLVMTEKLLGSVSESKPKVQKEDLTGGFHDMLKGAMNKNSKPRQAAKSGPAKASESGFFGAFKKNVSGDGGLAFARALKY